MKKPKYLKFRGRVYMKMPKKFITPWSETFDVFKAGPAGPPSVGEYFRTHDHKPDDNKMPMTTTERLRQLGDKATPKDKFRERYIGVIFMRPEIFDSYDTKPIRDAIGNVFDALYLCASNIERDAHIHQKDVLDAIINVLSVPPSPYENDVRFVGIRDMLENIRMTKRNIPDDLRFIDSFYRNLCFFETALEHFVTTVRLNDARCPKS